MNHISMSLIGAAIALLISFPSLGIAVDLAGGSVVCGSERELRAFEAADEETRDEMLKNGCRISKKVPNIHISMTRDDYVFISKSGQLPSGWTNKGSLLKYNNKDKYYYERDVKAKARKKYSK